MRIDTLILIHITSFSLFMVVLFIHVVNNLDDCSTEGTTKALKVLSALTLPYVVVPFFIIKYAIDKVSWHKDKKEHDEWKINNWLDQKLIYKQFKYNRSKK